MRNDMRGAGGGPPPPSRLASSATGNILAHVISFREGRARACRRPVCRAARPSAPAAAAAAALHARPPHARASAPPRRRTARCLAYRRAAAPGWPAPRTSTSTSTTQFGCAKSDPLRSPTPGSRDIFPFELNDGLGSANGDPRVSDTRPQGLSVCLSVCCRFRSQGGAWLTVRCWNSSRE